jgi:hypothetical protein
MKTPREILLARHKAVEPKLDDVRQSAVAAVYDRRSSPSPTVVAILKTLWHELVLPSRRIWTGLATVWILIVIANVAMRDHPQVQMAKSVSPEMVHSFQQQEQLLTELIGPFDLSAAEPQKTYAPRPSSQRFPEILAA